MLAEQAGETTCREQGWASEAGDKLISPCPLFAVKRENCGDVTHGLLSFQPPAAGVKHKAPVGFLGLMAFSLQSAVH